MGMGIVAAGDLGSFVLPSPAGNATMINQSLTNLSESIETLRFFGRGRKTPTFFYKDITATGNTVRYNGAHVWERVLTSGSPIERTLPATGTILQGDAFLFYDSSGDATANPITIHPNSSPIDGSTDDIVINEDYGFVWINAEADSTFSIIGGRGYIKTSNVSIQQRITVGYNISADLETAFTLHPKAIQITGIDLITTTTITANDTNYFEFQGQSAAGVVFVDDTDAANSTQATGGTGITQYVARSLTLHATPANLQLTANEVVRFKFLVTASPTTIESAFLIFTFKEIP